MRGELTDSDLSAEQLKHRSDYYLSEEDFEDQLDLELSNQKSIHTDTDQCIAEMREMLEADQEVPSGTSTPLPLPSSSRRHIDENWSLGPSKNLGTSDYRRDFDADSRTNIEAVNQTVELVQSLSFNINVDVNITGGSYSPPFSLDRGGALSYGKQEGQAEAVGGVNEVTIDILPNSSFDLSEVKIGEQLDSGSEEKHVQVRDSSLSLVSQLPLSSGQYLDRDVTIPSPVQTEACHSSSEPVISLQDQRHDFPVVEGNRSSSEYKPLAYLTNCTSSSCENLPTPSPSADHLTDPSPAALTAPHMSSSSGERVTSSSGDNFSSDDDLTRTEDMTRTEDLGTEDEIVTREPRELPDLLEDAESDSSPRELPDLLEDAESVSSYSDSDTWGGTFSLKHICCRFVHFAKF